MGVLLVVIVVHHWVPDVRWLMVHLVTLGLVTNSIMVWSQHFTESLLKNRLSDDARGRQLTRIRMLTALTGERVRIWVLAAGPSKGVSFHVVGGQFGTVYKEGAYLLPPGGTGQGGAQALDLAPAQGGFVELEFSEPGTYPFVNHSLAEAERGAKGLIRVPH